MRIILALLGLLTVGAGVSANVACADGEFCLNADVETNLDLGAVPSCGSFNGDTLKTVKAAVKRWKAYPAYDPPKKPTPTGGHDNDGSGFQNKGNPLPVLSDPNYYLELGLEPGVIGKNIRRAVISNKGAMFITFDHYKTFCKTDKGAYDDMWLQ